MNPDTTHPGNGQSPPWAAPGITDPAPPDPAPDPAGVTITSPPGCVEAVIARPGDFALLRVNPHADLDTAAAALLASPQAARLRHAGVTVDVVACDQIVVFRG
jgi:hypothetical protein